MGSVLFINIFTVLYVPQTDWLNFSSFCGLTLYESYFIQVRPLFQLIHNSVKNVHVN